MFRVTIGGVFTAPAAAAPALAALVAHGRPHRVLRAVEVRRPARRR